MQNKSQPDQDALQQQLLQREAELEEMTASLIEQQDQLMAVHELVEATREYLDLEKTIQVLASLTERLLGADTLFISLIIPEQQPLLFQSPTKYWPDEIVINWHQQMRTDQAAEWILDSRDDLYDRLKLAHTSNEVCAILFIRSAVRKNVDLMLGLVNKQSGKFQAPDLKLCRTLLQPTSAALATALLSQELVAQARLQTEMELAKQGQKRLLPQIFPEIDHLEGYDCCLPALAVGGDFYNYLIDGNGQLIFTFGDVSGKGFDALITMAIIHMVLQVAIQPDKANSPASLMQFAGERLYEHFSEFNKFATVFIGRFSPHDQTLLYANAGHAPVIYVPVDGSARLLEADGPPLGVLENSLSENYLLHLKKGDVLLIASDGLNEASDEAGNLFGYERLLALTEELSFYSPKTIVEKILLTIRTFSGNYSQEDDQTLIVLKVR